MKLVIVSATPHRRREDGVMVGWAATLRELDWVARLFDEVVHVAPVYPGAPQASDVPYAAENVRVVPLAPGGGAGVLGKLDALARVPGWLGAIRREIPGADVVHLRCPANVTLVATAWLRTAAPRPCWIKYAGNWRPDSRDAVSYRLQRFLLGRPKDQLVVTVNGRWPGDPEHVVPFLNPSFSESELAAARRAAEWKVVGPPWRLVFAGRLDEPKGSLRAVEICRRLRVEGHDVTLDVAGDGPLRAELEARARDSEGALRVHGWLAQAETFRLFARAHVALLPSRSSEGWPKVLSEGMAHGAVPVASDVSAVPQILTEMGFDTSLQTRDLSIWVDQLGRLFGDLEGWQRYSRRAVEAAEAFTFERYLEAIRNALSTRCRLHIPR